MTRILDSLVQDYGVSRRRAELGIRSALGATPGRLVVLVLRDVALVTAAGLALGAVVALALVATSASLWPASRAARIDVVESLRAE